MIHNRLRLPALALGGVAALSVIGAAAPGAAAPVRARPAGATATQLPAPPRFQVLTDRKGTAPGLFFTTPQSPKELNAPHGPEIVDGRGRPVWYQQVPAGQIAADLRVQRYRGKPVITWWQGTLRDSSNGGGVGYIADQNYRVIATVKGTAAPADLHEFKLTSRGTALLTEYEHVKMDLTPVGGPKDGTVLNGVVEEVDVATGKVLWRWRSLDHVPITETDYPYMATEPGMPYDYFHINSIDEDAAGDLLISGRFTSTVYKVSRKTGRIVWRLGGRHSDFPLGIGVRFSWQHDVSWAGEDLIKVFDNATLYLWDGYESRAAWIKIDPKRKTTRLVKQVTHPQHMSTVQEGSVQELPNGGSAVSWGPAGRISEFSPRGGLLFDAALPKTWSSYRIYRFPWTGRPATPPTAVVQGGTVHAVWNGATGVARWRVLAGSSQDALKPVAQVAWNGLDTAAPLPAGAPFVKVEALDAAGRVLGTSAAARAGK